MKLSHAMRRDHIKFLKFLKSGVAALLAVILLVSVFFSVPFIWEANAADNNQGQTRDRTVSDFQKRRWREIQSAVFNNLATKKEDDASVWAPDDIKGKTVKAGNPYFNWVSTGSNNVWTGKASSSFSHSSREKHTYGNVTANYYVFNVDTPAKFRYVIEKFNSLVSSSDQGVYIKINIDADLDMGGQNGVTWDPVDLRFCKPFKYQRYMYIEGNGHTIYNLKIVNPYHAGTNDQDSNDKIDADDKKGCGLMSNPPAFMVVKNLGFMSSMMINCEYKNNDDNADDAMQSGLICAYAPQKLYMYNVHSSGGYYQNTDADSKSGDKDYKDALGGIGGLIGRKDIGAHPQTRWAPMEDRDCGDTFFENCSTEKIYAYAENHVGGFSSFMVTDSYARKYKYGDDMPETPEQYVFDTGFVTTAVNTSYTTAERNPYIEQNSSSYPIMLKNCSSTDCELFSVGNDSGAFISCGTGFAVDGCFTNNTLYSSDNSGGFIGRVDSTKKPRIKDTNDGADTINTDPKKTGDSKLYYSLSSVFRNSYSSGIIEGKVAMGGFTGLDNSWRDRKNVHLCVPDSTAGYTKNTGATVYENCYSTTMVGMDYAGKYVGGFIGLDDNYNEEATVIADGKTFTGNGSFYINCYAAGEVGNILTITDTDDDNTIDLEQKYFSNYDDAGNVNSNASKNLYGEGKNNANVILDYYPTGGFAGVIGLDNYIYFRKNGAYGNNNNPTGVFHNCYYDMQTTAMHEMAVGLSGLTANQDLDSEVVKNGEVMPFSMGGIKGLYTQTSEHKGIDGLTDMNYMDAKNAQSNVWRYENQYYPQLVRNMSSDIDYADISSTTASNLTNLTGSEFYIEENTTATSNEYSIPVLSLGGSTNSLSKDITAEKKTAVAQMAQIVRAYRMSQASTATVLLDHWDIVMDTRVGLIQHENTAWQAQSRNKLKQYYVDINTGEIVAYAKYYGLNDKNQEIEIDNATYATRVEIVDDTGYIYAELDLTGKDGRYIDKSTGEYVNSVYQISGLKNTTDEWRITYENLDEGSYEFKIEEGLDAVNMNYGTDGYNGGNMTLNVPSSGSTVTIRFHYGELDSESYYIVSDSINPTTGSQDKQIHAKGSKAAIPGDFEHILHVRGTWDDWKTGRLLHETDVDENGNSIYTYVYKDMEPGEYEFRIGTSESTNWSESYGINGNPDENMKLSVTEKATVTFSFNYGRRITTVTAEPQNSISAVTITPPSDLYLRGDFVVNEEWVAHPEDLMTYEGELIYTHTKELKANTYEFKVGNADWSEDYGFDGEGGLDKNMSITLTGDATVTFRFDYATKLTTVSATPSTYLKSANTMTVNKNFYLLGIENYWQGTQYKLSTLDNNIYTRVWEGVSAGTHYFKIADRTQTESYGVSGGSTNMSLTLSSSTDLTFTFDYSTKLTTVTAEPSGNLIQLITTDEDLHPSRKLYVRGSFDKDWNALDDYLMTYNGNSIFSLTKSMAAGTYEFKIGSGDNDWAEDYGLDGKGGMNSNMYFTLKSATDVTFTFDYKTKLTKITASNPSYLTNCATTLDDIYSKKQLYVRGSFNEWYATDLMRYQGNSIYTYSMKLNTGTYEYKVGTSNWSEGYGIDGRTDGGDTTNIPLYLSSNATVTFTFDYNTKLTTVTSDPPEALSEKFSGEVSVNSPAIGEINMSYNDNNGWYEATKSITEFYDKDGERVASFDSVHGYRIVLDGNYSVPFRYFYLDAPSDESDKDISVTFHYKYETDEAYVTTDEKPNKEDVYQYASGVEFHVAGDEALTGSNWLDNYDNISGKMSLNSTLGRYTKTYENVPKGNHEFKIFGNGSDKLGIEYGNSYGGNYTFSLNQDANVTIVFNHISGVITVTTAPEEALDKKQYAVSGTSNLTGDEKSWENTYSHIMTYNDETGIYECIFNNVPCNENITYMISEVGSNVGERISFYLDSAKYASNTPNSIRKAKVKILYDENTGESEVVVLDSNDNDITALIKSELQIEFYGVVGDIDLTGYNWNDIDDVTKLKMAEKTATMDDPDGKYRDGDVYHIKEIEVEAPYNNKGKTYAFKVAANGTWDSGIVYGEGGLNGDNILFTVASKDESRQRCSVTIIFNETQGKIYYDIPDGFDAEINANTFDWYVIGVSGLTSLESEVTDPLVYDTVRDITRGFSFTSGVNSSDRGLTWQNNHKMNTYYDFKSDLGFDLEYSVKGIKSSTNFKSAIVDLKTMIVNHQDVNAAEEEDSLYAGEEYDGTLEEGIFSIDSVDAKYYVEDFAPGKQWLTVTTTGYGESTAFKAWKQNVAKYNRYVAIEKEYKSLEESYFKALNGFIYADKDNAYKVKDGVIYKRGNNNNYVVDSSITLVDLCKKMQSNADYLNIYASLAETYGDIIQVDSEKTIAKDYDESKIEFTNSDHDLQDQDIIGTRHLRLIPTAYIEAGVDAAVNVTKSDQARSREEQNDLAKNVVTYEDQTSDGLITAKNTGTGKVSDNRYEKYNLAFTAGYLATDKVGLGIFRNYNEFKNNTIGDQKINIYDKSAIRDDREAGERVDNTYFAMSSVFTMGAAYDDEYNPENKTYNNKVAVDQLLEQSVIGPAYDRSADTDESDKGKKANTIVKVYKHTSEGLSKVIMDSDPNAKGVHANNYRKWIGGNKQFTNDDIGTYTVTFLWALSDGRYLEDSKEVIVRAITSGLTKDVDITYTSQGDNKRITYTLTYTNGASSDAMNFAIMDLLPFNGDKRIDTSVVKRDGEEIDVIETLMKNHAMTLKSIDVYQSSGVQIMGVYHSTDTELRNSMYTTDSAKTPVRDSAKVLGLTDGVIDTSNNNWKTVSGANSITGVYKHDPTEVDPQTGLFKVSVDPPNGENGVDNAVALAVSGRVYAANQKVVIKFVVEADLVVDDYITNNGYYDVISVEDDSMRQSSISNPVATAVVGRDISGYAWWDINGNGIVDVDESFIKGMKADLYVKVGDQYVKDPGYNTVTTDEDGYYIFKGLGDGEYMVKFTGPDGGQFTVNEDVIDYSQTIPTKELGETTYSDKIRPRNIAVKTDDGSFVIEDRVMPSDEEVYSGNPMGASRINGSVDGYNYIKKYQNIGLQPQAKYSFDVHKEDEDGNSLEGAEFALEYKVVIPIKDESGKEIIKDGEVVTEDKWYAVYFEDQDGTMVDKSSELKTYEELAELEKIKAEGNTVLYFVPSENWKIDGARFAAYFFVGGTNTWASMADTDGDGVYTCKIPDGNWTNVIFCRMNPATAENNWDNKWNQTVDLTLSSENNRFTLDADLWNDATGKWSTTETSDYTYKYVTDEDGNFAVEDLNAGSYRITEVKTPSLFKYSVSANIPDFKNSAVTSDRLTYYIKQNDSDMYNKLQLILEDTISNGLSFVDIDDAKNGLVVSCGTKTFTQGTDYTATISGQKLTIKFTNWDVLMEYEGKTITAKYAATVDEYGNVADVDECCVKYTYPKLYHDSDNKVVHQSLNETIFAEVSRVRNLTSSIYFDLPYKVEASSNGTFVNVNKTQNDNNYINSDLQGNKYYKHVSFTIVDPDTFIIPLTGVGGVFVTAIFGVALLAVAAILFMLSKKKKEATALKH